MVAPTAISLEEVVMPLILTDRPLNDYFQTQNRVLEEAVFYPGRALDGTDKADVLGANTPCPFMKVSFGGESGNFAVYSGFSIGLYDDPDNRYWELYKMKKLLVGALHRKWADDCVDGYVQWERIDHIYASGGQVDPDWNLNYMLLRFQVYGIA